MMDHGTLCILIKYNIDNLMHTIHDPFTIEATQLVGFMYPTAFTLTFPL